MQLKQAFGDAELIFKDFAARCKEIKSNTYDFTKDGLRQSLALSFKKDVASKKEYKEMDEKLKVISSLLDKLCEF